MSQLFVVTSEPFVRPAFQSVHLGSITTFYCISDSEPLWVFNGGLPINAIYVGNNIILKKITYEQRGLYKCHSTLGNDSHISFGILKVKGKIHCTEHFFKPLIVKILS